MRGIAERRHLVKSLRHMTGSTFSVRISRTAAQPVMATAGWLQYTKEDEIICASLDGTTRLWHPFQIDRQTFLTFQGASDPLTDLPAAAETCRAPGKTLERLPPASMVATSFRAAQNYPKFLAKSTMGGESGRRV
ncbi:hypothetical protein K523DRAFT_36944 [Schizophyllum commune Tattone D]|nr:hypothetical protein K523DRAFT_36944 [Schizophyllum commune Tattone D]